MRKLLLSLIALSFVALAQQAQSGSPSRAGFARDGVEAPVEITAEPHHHLALENMFVRVFAVEVAPGESTLMHHHGHDYLSVSIGDAQVLNAKQGAQPVTANFNDGDTRFTPAGLVHAVTNSGTTPFRNSTIELLGPTTNQKACTESCAIPVPCDSADKAACVSVTKLITADQWSVTLINLPAGAKYPQHTHLANYLVIPLVDSDASVQNQDQPATTVHYKANEVRWNNPVVHTITNTGKTPARTVVLEFRGRPAGEGSESPGPKDAPKPHDHK
jgi:quercetin dioxygenase-like cupin family protein